MRRSSDEPFIDPGCPGPTCLPPLFISSSYSSISSSPLRLVSDPFVSFLISPPSAYPRHSCPFSVHVEHSGRLPSHRVFRFRHVRHLRIISQSESSVFVRKPFLCSCSHFQAKSPRFAEYSEAVIRCIRTYRDGILEHLRGVYPPPLCWWLALIVDESYLLWRREGGRRDTGCGVHPSGFRSARSPPTIAFTLSCGILKN